MEAKGEAKMISLGVGLIPSKESQLKLNELAKGIYDLNKENLIHNSSNTPHLTLFQGRFDSADKVIEIVKKLKITNLSLQKVEKLLIWGNWLFLNLDLTKGISEAHNNLAEQLIPLRFGKAIDFLDESYMSEGQIKSFNETGYQFSRTEFIPHITLLSLKERSMEINNLEETILPPVVEFSKIIIYVTGEGGACTEVLLEIKL